MRGAGFLASPRAKSALYIPARICARNRTVADARQSPEPRPRTACPAQPPPTARPSIRARSRASAPWRRSGGTRPARWACCTSSTRCGSATSRRRPAGSSAATPSGSTASPGLRILDIGCGAGILSEPLARLGAQVVGADPAVPNIEAAKAACRRPGARARLSRHHRRGAGGCGRALRPGARHGGGGACGRRRPVRAALRRDGEARRAPDRGHHQPHAQELRARHRGRRIRAALAAARHPPLGQVRDPQRIRGRARAPRPAGDRADRRGLRSARRPLAALRRHGRELHAGGREAAGAEKPRRQKPA